MNEINKVLESVRSILQGSRASSEEISCYDAFERAHNLLALDLENKGIECIPDIQPRDLSINLNPIYLQSILRNLISNAIKFSNRGDSIICFAHIEDGEIAIGVRDQGVGMSEEVRNKIFDENQTHTSFETLKEQGHGVGLMLVKKFAHLNHGRITCSSAIGQGTEITLHFPLGT